jgi:hypothetical protein
MAWNQQVMGRGAAGTFGIATISSDVNFQDENIFTYQERVAGIAEEFIRRDLSFTWFGTMRADQVSVSMKKHCCCASGQVEKSDDRCGGRITINA